MVSAAVVDASVLVKLFVKEVDSASARLLINRLDRSSVRVVAPIWCHSELANALLQAIYRGDLDLQDAAAGLRELPRFVHIVEAPIRALSRALEMAMLLRMRSIYDVQYLALAEELGCDYWTADERFWQLTRARFPFVRWIGELSH